MFLNYSGMMHTWLCPKITVAGHNYIALRGVNWRGEYDQAHPHGMMGVAWWHVPSTKFAFDRALPPPDIQQTLNIVLPMAIKEWPALESARIAHVDQNLAGWGGVDGEGRQEPVTRIAFDLGVRDELPKFILRPNDTLPWPRHPVEWIPVDQIGCFDTEMRQGNQRSPYIVEGDHVARMEMPEGPRRAIARDFILQANVAEMFENAYGPDFFPRRHMPVRPDISPDLAICGVDLR